MIKSILTIGLVSFSAMAPAGDYLGVDVENDNIELITERLVSSGTEFDLADGNSLNGALITQVLRVTEKEGSIGFDFPVTKHIVFNGQGKVLIVGVQTERLDSALIGSLRWIYPPEISNGEISQSFDIHNDKATLVYRHNGRNSQIVPAQRALSRMTRGLEQNCSTALEEALIPQTEFASYLEIKVGMQINSINGDTYTCRTPTLAEVNSGYHPGVPRLFLL